MGITEKFGSNTNEAIKNKVETRNSEVAMVLSFSGTLSIMGESVLFCINRFSNILFKYLTWCQFYLYFNYFVIVASVWEEQERIIMLKDLN